MRKAHAGRMKTSGGVTKPTKIVKRRDKFAAALSNASKLHNRKSKAPVPVDENE
jgi:hypothetical protein